MLSVVKILVHEVHRDILELALPGSLMSWSLYCDLCVRCDIFIKILTR